MEQVKKRKRCGNWLEEDKVSIERSKLGWRLKKGDKRNVPQLKAQWTFIKIVAKKDVASHRRDILKTGGGPPPAEKAASASDLSVWLPNEFVIDSNEFDSDIIILENSVVSGITEIEESGIETFSKAEGEQQQPKEDFQPKKIKKKNNPTINKNLANNKIKELADFQIKSCEELHQLKVMNEEKTARNLDLEYDILKEKYSLLKEKIKFFKNKQLDNDKDD